MEVMFEVREIFVRHGNGLRRYPWALARILDNSTKEELWSGLAPNGDAIYNSPMRDCLDTPQIMEPLIDPPIVYSDDRASGQMYN